MRETFTFTIDPADAKDFDDALSFECLSGAESDGLLAERSVSEAVCQAQPVYQIGVHIADVSFYVRPGTKIDEDAYKRGTSVYLVDRVLPMLPEELCNDKCSLRPGEDKLCMSVIFTMDDDARVLKYKICRTVIRSDARLNYDEAQDVIMANQTSETLSRENRNGGNTGEKASLKQALATLNTLAQKLRAERIANGALTIEQDEMRFRLDKNGFPTEIYFEQPNEAHHLIEEFMLLANRTVAKAVGSGRPFVYRVHDLPDGEKLENAKQFQKRFPQLRNAYDLLTIRAQAKAVYSTYNIGHYGLAFTHYTHFTSPIRRYPAMTREQMEEMCEHCSAREQEAAQAERDSIKMFQAMWITSHVGEILPGHISGVTDFGLFVQLDESRCEGLVHITKIGAQGEYWQYDEKNYRLVCEHGKKAYTLGDPVVVQVVRADINKGQIDFELVPEEPIKDQKA